MSEIQDKVRAYIKDVFLFGDDSGYAADESLMEAGIIDSVGVLELVSFVEEEFGVEVEDSDLIPDNFDTLESIASYIGRKVATAA